jgi:hypothetical protein
VTTVAEILVDADADAWRAVGFHVEPSPDDPHAGMVRLGGIRLRLTGGTTGGGITAWVLADAPDATITEIDGLRTTHGEPPDGPPQVHPNGVSSLDHIVINTARLEHTCEALAAATDAPLKRIRDAGPIRQGFHRLGELIVEVVTHPGITATAATFWGLACNVDDIDALFARCGDGSMSPPKDAVQPGRRIASFRIGAGLGTPVAVMTPRPGR